MSEEQSEQIQAIISRLQSSDSLEECIWELESNLLELFKAERFTLYQMAPSGNELVSWYRTASDNIEEIRLPLAPSSIAGYVAMTQKPLLIADAYDADELESIDPNLHFDHSYDQESGFLTESMIVIPLVNNDMIYGVMQVINYLQDGRFSDESFYDCTDIVDIIVDKFRYELKTIVGPYNQLIKNKRMTHEQLDLYESKARKEKVPVTHIIRQELDLHPEEIGASLTEFYQMPFQGYSESINVGPDVLGNLNRSFLANQRWLPITNNGKVATILIADPHNQELLSEIQNIVPANEHIFKVSLEEDILHFLGLDPKGDPIRDSADLSSLLNEMGDELDAMNESSTTEIGDEKADLLDGDASSIIRLVNKIIVDAVKLGASDIHIEPLLDKPGIVRMRVDGVCRQELVVPEMLIRPVVSRIKILSGLDIAEKRKPQDGKMALSMGGVPLELRVATLPIVSGESVVMRILQQGEPLPFEKLNLMPKNEEMIDEFLTHHHGICLVVGPTGSGKTTTLHAILGVLNTPEVKILTAEDPVEITQDGLQQVQIARKAGLDFAAALRSFLRCDPDIILIGEMRDHETAASGIEASLTGHLVFSTLHTNSAPETVIRLLDMGLDPMNFADALVGIIAQRLARTLCGKCKEEYTPDEEELDKLIHLYGEDLWDELGYKREEVVLCRPIGCEACGKTGYKGRTGCHEVLPGTDAMKKLVSQSAKVPEIKTQAIKDGMRTLGQDAIAKVFKGQLDLKMARKVSS